MSGRRAKAQRKAAGGFVKHQKQPTAILDAAYIQAPVGWDPVKQEPIYRSGKQVKAYLTKRVGAKRVAALQVELEQLLAEGIPEEEDVDAA